METSKKIKEKGVRYKYYIDMSVRNLTHWYVSTQFNNLPPFTFIYGDWLSNWRAAGEDRETSHDQLSCQKPLSYFTLSPWHPSPSQLMNSLIEFNINRQCDSCTKTKKSSPSRTDNSWRTKHQCLWRPKPEVTQIWGTQLKNTHHSTPTRKATENSDLYVLDHIVLHINKKITPIT